MISYELKQRWVEALRTGKYRPHRGTYYGPGGSACALGVLWREAGSRMDWRREIQKLPQALQTQIMRKNDFWRWSQHHLAWWIDTYVPSEPEELTLPRE